VRSICARSMAASGASNEIAMRISVSLALALGERANRTVLDELGCKTYGPSDDSVGKAVNNIKNFLIEIR
jgi:hypothetical protein